MELLNGINDPSRVNQRDRRGHYGEIRRKAQKSAYAINHYRNERRQDNLNQDDGKLTVRGERINARAEEGKQRWSLGTVKRAKKDPLVSLSDEKAQREVLVLECFRRETQYRQREDTK